MYISVPNRNSPPAVLLRESFRDAGKVKKRTLANLSKWPPTLIRAAVRVLLKRRRRGVPPRRRLSTSCVPNPHGHVQPPRSARCASCAWSAPSPARTRPSAGACWTMIVARVLEPGSKLATARSLAADTAHDSLAETLELEDCDED